MSNQKTAEPTTALAIVDGLRAELAPIAEQSGGSFERIATAFRIAVQQNPDILKCSYDSLRRELSKCAVDGLVPDSKEAVILPYWDKDAKEHQANYQPMVYGVIKRMRELGEVYSIVCECVYEKDRFSVNLSDLESLVHETDPFSTERGAVKGAYVIFRDEKNRVMHREIMGRTDLDKVRQASKSPNSPAWRVWEDQMFRKAVLRRGSRYITINNDRLRQIIERQDALFESYAERKAPERINPFGGPTIDHDAPAGESSEATVEKDPPSTGAEGSGASPQGNTPPEPSLFPERIKDADMPALDEILNKVVNLAGPDDSVDAPDRRGVIKANVAFWKEALPEYLHPLLKHVIGITDNAILKQAKGCEWQKETIRSLAEVTEATGIEFKQGWL